MVDGRSGFGLSSDKISQRCEHWEYEICLLECNIEMFRLKNESDILEEEVLDVVVVCNGQYRKPVIA